MFLSLVKPVYFSIEAMVAGTYRQGNPCLIFCSHLFFTLACIKNQKCGNNWTFSQLIRINSPHLSLEMMKQVCQIES